jgi:hypothetical protein
VPVLSKPAGRIETMTNTDNKQQRPPLALLRYPGAQAGESAYAVIRPSTINSDMYEIASSWFDSEAEGLAELRRMRGAAMTADND